MACPVCGGADRDPIAPGYWRCTSLRLIVTEVGGPGLTNPLAGPPVIRQEQLVECGAEYQEGGAVSVEECSCGTFAIGRCGECRQPVCGSHSGLWEGRRLCEPHLRAAHAAAQKQQAEAQARGVADAIAASVRSWDGWLAAARATLAQTPDPVERTVRVVAALSGSWPGRLPEDRQLLLTLLLPEQLAGLEPDVRWWWDHDAVQAWFLQAVKVPPVKLKVVSGRRTLLGGTKREQTRAPGWEFPNGSTVGHGEGHMRWWLSVSVLADGRRLLGANADAGSRTGFNETALTLMAERAQLELLPAFPSVSIRHPQTRARIWPA